MILDDAQTNRFKKRLKQLVNEALKTRGLSARAASIAVIGHDGLIRDIRADRVPSADKLEALLNYLGLEFYLGPPRETAPVEPALIDGEHFAAIPRFSAELAAGNGHANDDDAPVEHLAFSQKWLQKMGILATQACLVTVKGDSMVPVLYSGDLVLIDRRRTTVRNGRIYALTDLDGTARVKRLELIKNQMLLLRSDNPAFETEFRQGNDMNQVTILGEVVWSGHQLDQAR